MRLGFNHLRTSVRTMVEMRSTRTLGLKSSLMHATRDWVEDRESLVYLRGAPKT